MTKSSSAGTVTIDGRGTMGGGGGNVVQPPPPPPVVTNQQLLVLDGRLFEGIPEHVSRKIKLIQLEFARDISALAVAAYDRIIEELRPHCE